MQPARFVGVSVRATGFWCLYMLRYIIYFDQNVYAPCTEAIAAVYKKNNNIQLVIF